MATGHLPESTIPTVPWKTLASMLEDNFRRFADQGAVIDGDTRLTYRQLGDRVTRTASILRHMGVLPGDRVVIYAPNSHRWMIVAMACWHSEIVLAPLSPSLRPIEAQALLDMIQPKLLFASSAISKLVPDGKSSKGAGFERPDFSASDIQIVSLDESVPTDPREMSWTDFQSKFSNSSVPVAGSGAGYCEIMLTSGSTGAPKGVLINEEQLLASFWCLGHLRGWSSRDSHLLMAPMSHVTGLHAGLLTGLMFGATAVMVGAFHPLKVLAVMEREVVSNIAGPPEFFQQLQAESIQWHKVASQLRIALIIGAPATELLLNRLVEKSKIAEIFVGYAMTESCGICTTRRGDKLADLIGSVGKPIPGMAIKLMDENSREVPVGEPGEIFVKGFAVMHNYLDSSGRIMPSVNGDGWLNTGDIGVFAENGSLRIVGRKKDMYIAYGFSVYPAEVERTLMNCQLLDNVAIVPRNNKFSGQEGVAFVVPKDHGTFNRRDFYNWCRLHLAKYKIPGKLVVCEVLPLNSSGKVDKVKLAGSLTRSK